MDQDLSHFYSIFGVLPIRGLFSKDELEHFINSHQGQIDLSSDWSQSYLGSREDFIHDESIRLLLCSEKVNNIFAQLDLKMMLVVAEARLASSNISWHRDVTWQTYGMPQYIVAQIALSDSSDGAGLLSYVPRSHLWDVDYETVGRNSIDKDSGKGYKYYEDMIEEKSGRILRFDAKAGDVIFWNGNTVHRGEAGDPKAIRHSLTGHFTHQDQRNIEVLSHVGYHGGNNENTK